MADADRAREGPVNLNKILVVYKKSTLELSSGKKGDRAFRQLIRKKHPTTTRFVPNHETHHRVLDGVRRTLDRRGLNALFVYRAQNFTDHSFDLVMTVGGDGTFLDAAQSVSRAPMLGVNSSPLDSVGMFCGTYLADLNDALDAIIEDRWKPVVMTRLRAKIGKKVYPYPVLNDILVAHANPGATSKFILEANQKREDFKSSGVWIAPAAGTTAGIASAGGKVMPIESRGFQYLVREPYLPTGKRSRLVGRVLSPKETFSLHSKMRSGRIYIDGAHHELDFPIGEKLTVSTKAPTLSVLGFDRKRREKFSR